MTRPPPRNPEERGPALPPYLREHGEGVILRLRVVPRSRTNAVDGPLGDLLKVRLTSPPVEGKANECLRRFLADLLDLPSRSVDILAGEASRTKAVLLRGARADAVLDRLCPGGKDPE
ncbi:MAG: DUF167 domain-containing protein [Lentisphaeria bacterium]|nr:DUF167 domain-containing protein [Lentisphaeria bacterium]